MPSQIEKTQAQLLKHHGGNGFHASQMIANSYENRHDKDFWLFWEQQVACHYLPGDGVIDMGAGIGQFIRDCALRYPQSPIFGLEAAAYMLSTPLRLPDNAQLIKDDLSQPLAPIADNSVAMIMANMVVHELNQPIKMFKAAYRWLKPGGRFCMIDVVRQPLQNYMEKRYTQNQIWGESTLVEDLEKLFEHYLEHNRYHPHDLIYLLQTCGFQLIENSSLSNNHYVRLVVEKPQTTLPE